MIHRRNSRTILALLVVSVVICAFVIAFFVEAALADEKDIDIYCQKQKKKVVKLVKKPVKKTPHPYPYGKVIAKPPAKHSVLKVNGRPYYYHNGVFFWPGKNGYSVIAGPVGARISVLPPGYKRISVNNVHYYYFYGTYYRYDPVDKIYIVIESPLGAEVDELPDGSEILYLDEQAYYYYHGTFYIYDEGRGVYIVVRAPQGIILKTMPMGSEEVLLDGNRHFLFRGIYYQPVVQDGVTVYKVVK
jgi:hypothetical protein